MKVAMFFLFTFSFSVLASDLRLKDFNWDLTDIADRGLTKETLFTRMDRKFIKTGSSICSNRALMWANEFKRKQNLDTGKIFLFYTKKKGDLSLKTWWYHVAPVINERGQVWVMDAGFRGFINQPLQPIAWLEKFADSTNCKEIGSHETELVDMMFSEQVFPKVTSYGHYDCYYKIVPHTLWTPDTVAKNILGRDSNGRPVRLERHEINKDELYQACVEATSTKIGWALGTSKKKCEEYVGI